MTTGRRFGGPDAQSFGIVDATADEDRVTTAAVDVVRPLQGKDPGTLGAIKQTMFGHVVAALTDQPND
jgi:enoyl-CoA hydratase/carnithine racemase